MSRPFDTVAVTVIDGVGCGESIDCKEQYPEDRGANSLLHASLVESIDAPALQSMGLGLVPGLIALETKTRIQPTHVRGGYGALEPTFAGKGSPEGHQALMGWEVKEPYLYFDKEGFPPALIEAIERELSNLLHRPVEVIRYPGTDDKSGTDFINDPRIGEVHLNSALPRYFPRVTPSDLSEAKIVSRGTRDTRDDTTPLKLPVYASSDSVVQIAIHQEVLSQGTIEAIGRTVREKVCDALGFRVGRVIMRPFVNNPRYGQLDAQGKPEPLFIRVSADRRDYAVDPDGPTVIDHLTANGIPVYGIGKAADMLNRRGFPVGSIEKGKDDFEMIETLKQWLQHTPPPCPPPSGEVPLRGEGKFIFANLNATDELYGHRRKPREYVEHINRIDQTIEVIMRTMNDRTLLIMTSDHGNDPTHMIRMDGSGKPHTNHTRERVPLLVYSPRISTPISLGIRRTYADVAATIGENFGLQETFGNGKSFLDALL